MRMFSRVIARPHPDKLNPFLPPPFLNLLGEMDEPQVAVGGIRENANVAAKVMMITGSIIGSIALYKGKYVAGALAMGAGVIGGAVIEGVAEASAKKEGV